MTKTELIAFAKKVDAGQDFAEGSELKIVFDILIDARSKLTAASRICDMAAIHGARRAG